MDDRIVVTRSDGVAPLIQAITEADVAEAYSHCAQLMAKDHKVDRIELYAGLIKLSVLKRPGAFPR